MNRSQGTWERFSLGDLMYSVSLNIIGIASHRRYL